VRAGAVGGQAGAAPAGGPRVRDDDPVAAGAAGLAGLRAGELVRDGSHVGVLEAAVLPARRRGRVLGGQRPRRQERAGPAEDGPAGRGLAGQVGRAGDAAAIVRAAALAAGAAGLVPVPAHPDPGAFPGEAACGEAAGGHPDQAVERDQRHLRQVGAGDAGGADRRAARPAGAGGPGGRPATRQQNRLARGADRALPRPPRLPPAHDA
jgi:hypothetical protein